MKVKLSIRVLVYYIDDILAKFEKAMRLLAERKKRKGITTSEEKEEENENEEVEEVEDDSSGDEEPAVEEFEKPVLEKKEEVVDEEERMREQRRERKRLMRQKKAEEKKKITEMRKNMSPKEKEEELKRTIFVGNVPVGADKKKFEKFFGKYGKVIASRFRDIPLSHPGSKETRKKGVIKKDFHPERTSMNAYVVFEERKAANDSLAADGTVFMGNHLRVDLATGEKTTKDDTINCAYVSNLPFGTEEEDLHNIFSSCGSITRVRVIRDPFYKACKGFAYVKFDNEEGLTEALALDQKITYKEKKIHVAKASSELKKKPQKNKTGNNATSTSDNEKSKKRKPISDPKKLQEKYKNKRRKIMSAKK